MARVYGIDLGTTYSAISYLDENGQPVIISNPQHGSTTCWHLQCIFKKAGNR